MGQRTHPWTGSGGLEDAVATSNAWNKPNNDEYNEFGNNVLIGITLSRSRRIDKHMRWWRPIYIQQLAIILVFSGSMSWMWFELAIKFF